MKASCPRSLAALLLVKAVLVVDSLPFMHRFDGAPLIQPILFKFTICWLCVAARPGEQGNRRAEQGNR
jgi:hypothetical protein